MHPTRSDNGFKKVLESTPLECQRLTSKDLAGAGHKGQDADTELAGADRDRSSVLLTNQKKS